MLVLQTLAVAVMLEGGEGVGGLYTGNNGLGVAVSEALGKTLTREMEALEDHLGDGGTLQMGRVRLWRSVAVRACLKWNTMSDIAEIYSHSS